MSDLLIDLWAILPPLLLFFVGLLIVFLSLSQRVAWQLEWSPEKLLRLLPVGLLTVILALGWLIYPEIQSYARSQMQPNATGTPSTPTPLPPPFLSIESPRDNIPCQLSRNTCWFMMDGTFGGVFPIDDYRIYTFVFPTDPRGPGYYLHELPAILSPDGKWNQARATYGDRKLPAKSGQEFIIQAMLAEKNAAYNNTLLADLPPNFYLGSLETIEGIIKISEPLLLTVE